eukprot:jgi/Mesvir1/21678/Mv04099-RA.1
MEKIASLEASLRQTLAEEALARSRDAEVNKRTPVASTVETKPAAAGISRPDGAHNDRDSARKDTEDREVEIQRRKQAVQRNIETRLQRVGEEARRLDELRKELENVDDPIKEDVADLRLKIDALSRELRPLTLQHARKEKELATLSDLIQQKKSQLGEFSGQLQALIFESERIRMAKLEELNKVLEAMERL